jgi:hypothetical protein
MAACEALPEKPLERLENERPEESFRFSSGLSVFGGFFAENSQPFSRLVFGCPGFRELFGRELGLGAALALNKAAPIEGIRFLAGREGVNEPAYLPLGNLPGRAFRMGFYDLATDL